MLHVVQHGIQSPNSRDTEWSGRKSGMFVGIVGRIDLQMFEQDTLEGEIAYGKLHGRIRLKGNATLQAINI